MTAAELRALAAESLALVSISREQAIGLAEVVDGLCAALEELAERASNFSVSGVYFDEACMKPERAALANAYAALAKARGDV